MMNPLFLIALSIAIVAALACYAAIAAAKRRANRRKRSSYKVERHPENPIIKPRKDKEWETQGTFNPGTVMDDDGKVHLFYRAIGNDGLSRVGHAVSHDGKRFFNRSDYPVYVPQAGYGMPEPTLLNAPHRYDASAHASGGGWGGAEDPRVVKIEGRVFMTYTAFEGWSSMRIGLTSIKEEDMKNEHWKWKRPVIISPPGARAKNWVLFPEKINGRYAILHGIAPKIMIAYTDNPEMVPEIESQKDSGGSGYEDPSRKGFWDSRVRGAGAPPMKTSLGWLLLYHAFDTRDPKKAVGYKVGAMILDLHDPTKVLYRSPEPILSPDMQYENDGKPGVVYASGAVIKNDRLLVYYGGGDKHTCVAETPLESMLAWLKAYGKVE